MPDFSKFLRTSAGNAVRPAALPIELYPGKIASYELGDRNRNNTPYVQFNLVLTGWPDSVPESLRATPNRDGTSVPIDLSRRRLNTKFYLTDDAYWRLDEFYRSVGIDPTDKGDMELFQMVVGSNVNVQVGQYLSTSTNELANQVDRVFGDHKED